MIQPRYDGFWHRSLGCMDRISLVAFLRDETGNCHFRLISALCGRLLHKLEYVTKRRYIFLVVKNLIPMDSLCRRNDVCLPALSPLQHLVRTQQYPNCYLLLKSEGIGKVLVLCYCTVLLFQLSILTVSVNLECILRLCAHSDQ